MQRLRFYRELDMRAIRNSLGAYFTPGNGLGPRETALEGNRQAVMT